MKIKKRWDVILLMPLVMIPICLIVFFTREGFYSSIPSCVFAILSVAFGYLQWIQQDEMHNTLYEKINEGSLIPVVFKNELKPAEGNKVWAYYELDWFDIGVKLDKGVDYPTPSLNPHTLIQDIKNYKIHLRG